MPITYLISHECDGNGLLQERSDLMELALWHSFLGLALLVLAFRADSFRVRKDGDCWDGEFRAK